MSGDKTTVGRIEITPHIRVLEAGADGWAVWDDYAEECPLYPTASQAVAAARQIADEYAIVEAMNHE